MALIMEIMKTIAQPIGELAIWFEETYQVEASETIAKWRELTGMNITVKEGDISHDEVQSLNVDSTKNVKLKKIPKTKDVCQHIFLSGQKVGEQCTTKPKGGASYCSAHRPKDSVKSAKSAKTPKKKEVKKVEKIDSEFGSDSEQEEKPVKVSKEPKKSTKIEKVVPKEQPKPVIEDDDMTSDSDGEPISRAVKYSEAYMDEKEANLDKEKYRKKPKPVVVESDDDDLSEPQKPVRPLLKKKNLKNGPVKPSKKAYETDEEVLDKDLDLSDDD
jgi:hypothetical protein